jgi:Zn-finger nucleic acid-binding protein
LGHQKIGGAELDACATCGGMLVTQSALMPLLEAVSGDLMASFDADAKLEALPARPETIACPSCRAAMEKADYCGAKLVGFDRCTRCALLWLANEELGGMSLMWARMEKRLARTQAQNADDLSAMEGIADAARLRRVVDNALFRRLL